MFLAPLYDRIIDPLCDLMNPVENDILVCFTERDNEKDDDFFF